MLDIKFPSVIPFDLEEFKKYFDIQNSLDLLKYLYEAHEINYSFDYQTNILFNDLDLNIIIPVRNRDENLKCIVKSLLRNSHKKKIAITIVEYDKISKYSDIEHVNYIFIPENKLYFPKSLCQNIGAMMIKSKYLLFHDADCVVTDTFLSTIEKCIDLEIPAVQPYNKKRILNLDLETSKIIRMDINLLNSSLSGIITPGIGSTGGSLLVSRNLFYNVGGYDPELFWDYSIEDTFFWKKLGKVIYLDDILIVDDEIYHLHHCQLGKQCNLYFISMELTYKLLESLEHQEFLEFLEYRKKYLLGISNIN